MIYRKIPKKALPCISPSKYKPPKAVTFVFCFVQFFLREQISVLNIVPPPWPVLKFRDLVRKWHHNSDDSTDIIFRLILSVLYFSLISSCVIHHLLWHLFFAAQFQGKMICFHYCLDLLVYISILLYTPYWAISNIEHYSWTDCENLSPGKFKI